jgi:hypothetical protein
MADHVRKDSRGLLDQEDTWRKIVMSLTGKSKERGSLTSRIRDMRNHDTILVVRSRFVLDR